MIKAIFFSILAAVSVSHPISQEVIDKIRSLTNQWEPHSLESNPLAKLSEEQLRSLVGTLVPPSLAPTSEDRDHNRMLTTLPTNFDMRSDATRGACIHPIRDQQSCGSCWAFAGTEALSDRFCMKGVDVILSPEYLLSCDTNNYGCSGGYLNETWTFLEKVGAVTDSCDPYVSGPGTSVPACPTSNFCSDGVTLVKTYKCASGSVVHPTTVAAIQTEIYNNGPVEASFQVYNDFYSYKSGVYAHKTGAFVGNHAIKIVGWGVLNGRAYWLCANSWGISWGVNGYFMIQ